MTLQHHQMGFTYPQKPTFWRNEDETTSSDSQDFSLAKAYRLAQSHS